MIKKELDYAGINASIKIFQTGMPNSTTEVAKINDALTELDGISKIHGSFLSTEVSNVDVTAKLDTANTNYENYIKNLQTIIYDFKSIDVGGDNV